MKAGRIHKLGIGVGSGYFKSQSIYFESFKGIYRVPFKGQGFCRVLRGFYRVQKGFSGRTSHSIP